MVKSSQWTARACFWSVEEDWGTRRKPTQTQVEHANYTQNWSPCRVLRPLILTSFHRHCQEPRTTLRHRSDRVDPDDLPVSGTTSGECTPLRASGWLDTAGCIPSPRGIEQGSGRLGSWHKPMEHLRSADREQTVTRPSEPDRRRFNRLVLLTRRRH